MNPFAQRLQEAAFTLENTQMAEIAEMLHIGAREIERQAARLQDWETRTAALRDTLAARIEALRAELDTLSQEEGKVERALVSCEEQREALRKLVATGYAVVLDFMPNIGQCVLQDYARLNKFLIEAERATS